mmetsp:Transcript_59835/g.143770  ORF Transcript_59835/g.143770 Transcript_59835/m.143770 type:complete len:414 (+) Transcript_59835:185-1426(+)
MFGSLIRRISANGFECSIVVLEAPAALANVVVIPDRRIGVVVLEVSSVRIATDDGIAPPPSASYQVAAAFLTQDVIAVGIDLTRKRSAADLICVLPYELREVAHCLPVGVEVAVVRGPLVVLDFLVPIVDRILVVYLRPVDGRGPSPVEIFALTDGLEVDPVLVVACGAQLGVCLGFGSQMLVVNQIGGVFVQMALRVVHAHVFGVPVDAGSVGAAWWHLRRWRWRHRLRLVGWRRRVTRPYIVPGTFLAKPASFRACQRGRLQRRFAVSPRFQLRALDRIVITINPPGVILVHALAGVARLRANPLEKLGADVHVYLMAAMILDLRIAGHGRCCGAAVAVLVALGAGQCTERRRLIRAPIEVKVILVMATVALDPQPRVGGAVGDIPMGGCDLKRCTGEAHRRRHFCSRRQR